MDRVLIIEDEQLAAEKLQMLINRIDPDFQVIDVISTVADSVRWLTNNQADLIFLDINLADDISFRIFDQIEVDTPIIFTTAYDDYAIKAFKQNSLDYILKPVSEEDLRLGITKYKKLKSNGVSYDQQIKSFIQQYLPSTDYKNRILVSYGGKSKSINIEEVAYLYAFEKGVYLTSMDNHSYLVDDTLDVLEKHLDPKHFYRVNRKFLINIKSIVEIHKYSTRRLKLELKPKPKFEALVPAEKITAFRAWLNS